jgi:hypothetical protein
MWTGHILPSPSILSLIGRKGLGSCQNEEVLVGYIDRAA